MAIFLGLSDTGWVSWNPPRVLALAASLPIPQIHFHLPSTHLISPTRPPEKSGGCEGDVSGSCLTQGTPGSWPGYLAGGPIPSL